MKKDWSKILILGDLSRFKSENKPIEKVNKANALKEILNSNKRINNKMKKPPIKGTFFIVENFWCLLPVSLSKIFFLSNIYLKISLLVLLKK